MLTDEAVLLTAPLLAAGDFGSPGEDIKWLAPVLGKPPVPPSCSLPDPPPFRFLKGIFVTVGKRRRVMAATHDAPKMDCGCYKEQNRETQIVATSKFKSRNIALMYYQISANVGNGASINLDLEQNATA